MIRVAFLVNGFPHSGQPYRGLHNLRTVKALAGAAAVTVVFLRTWLPGRPAAALSEYE